MKKIISYSSLMILFFTFSISAQFKSDLKLKENKGSLSANSHSSYDNTREHARFFPVQLKPRKTVTTYVGAGYSFVIFTAHEMNTGYPVFDTRSGDFLSEINLYVGFAIAKALTLEFEPSILFTRNNREIQINLNQPKYVGIDTFNYDFPSALSMIAFPLAINARFFPFFATKGFGRLFFVGAGGGVIWIREEYDNNYTNTPTQNYYGYNSYFITESTSQWAPLLRLMTGFTGTGGQFGFGGEIRYNFVPLKKSDEAFITRIAPNFNSVDISLRFYFSL
ncbi:MAG: hypothetical protein ABSF32_03260 [Ignavibacteria bacterium]|jgi:hypothetical protein